MRGFLDRLYDAAGALAALFLVGTLAMVVIAAMIVLEQLSKAGVPLSRLSGAAHRVVHGGASLVASCRVTEAVMAEGECDVLLTHDCPEGVPIPGTDRDSSLEFWPEQELRTAWAHRELLAEVATALRPTRLWHGHFHMPYRCDVELVPGVRTRAQGLGAEFQGLSGVHELALATLEPDISRRRTV